jgi:hypothetical protein
MPVRFYGSEAQSASAVFACQYERMKVTMKTVIAVFLLMSSTSLLAARPDCSYDPGGCRNGVPSGRIVLGDEVVSVPEPGMLALIGMSMAGLVVARRRKR